MAKLLDSADAVISFPIEKVEKDENGDLFVYGKATDASLDSDSQILDLDWSAKAIADWFNTGGNVRVQHSPYLYPAGVGVEVVTNKDGGHWVKSKVVEPTAKKLVEEGVLKAYSVGVAGPKIIRDNVAKNGRVNGGRIVEISLVDRPANPNCGVTLVKADAEGNAARRDELVVAEDLLAKYRELTEPDLAKAGATHGAFTGTHSHAHDANGASGGDEVHTHAHSHDGDVNHGHDHGKAADPELEKKDMDPNVGGGVDRDKIPAEDFAGKNRSFPIVTPGDVADAASSIGRAGDDNYSSDTLKANIIRIAERKGPSFVAKLPDAWKEKTDQPDLAKDAIPAGKDVDTTVAAHREPDGDEGGPDLDRDGDGTPPATGVKSVTDVYEVAAERLVKGQVRPSYVMHRLHDALCAAYAPDDVAEAYPSLKGIRDAALTGLDEAEWRKGLIEAAQGGDYARVGAMTELLTAATTLKQAEPAVLADARAELAKDFSTAYPDVHLTPTSGINPGQFTRPYISAGHAPLHKADIPTPTHVLDGSTAGTAAATPAGPVNRRSFYTNTARDSAKAAMQAVHDYIANAFPDICALTTKADMSTATMPNRSHNTLEPVSMPATAMAPGEKNDLPDLIKSLTSEQVAAVRAYYDERIAALETVIEKMAAEPDPSKAPVRGVMAKADSADRPSRVDDARVAKTLTDAAEYAAYLDQLAKSGNPVMREQARAVITKAVTAE